MNEQVKTRKKLIEVALPLEAINIASAEEKGNPFLKSHPRNLHQWWARRPSATCRAVIAGQMIDDPASVPELFPTEKAQEQERQRLFKLIEELVKWENTTNEIVLNQAREEMWKSWRRACADNKDHPRAKELFNPEKLPPFHDPFAGGGALPLEAQRLGLEAYASDLNPVAVLINKAMIEIPPRFAGIPPVNPESRKDQRLLQKQWHGAEGLAEDVRYYGRWMRDEAEKRIGHLYPKVEITAEMAKDRPDLKPLVGQKLTITAWLWARTVKSPNPAFAEVNVPLISTFLLSSKPGKETYVEPNVEGSRYSFAVRIGKALNDEAVKNGTRLTRGANFKCLVSGTPISAEYIKSEAQKGHIGIRLMAIVAEGERTRIYLAPTAEAEDVALAAKPEWKPEIEFLQQALGFRVGNYGMENWSGLFTARQLAILSTLSRLAQEIHEIVTRDSSTLFSSNASMAARYADSVTTFLALCIDKYADYNNALCTWNPTNQNIGHLFTKQVIPMAWDFAEASPLDGGLSFSNIAMGVAASLERLPANHAATAFQSDAAAFSLDDKFVYSTDPPYYDNIGYADLSDFFYV